MTWTGFATDLTLKDVEGPPPPDAPTLEPRLQGITLQDIQTVRSRVLRLLMLATALVILYYGVAALTRSSVPAKGYATTESPQVASEPPAESLPATPSFKPLLPDQPSGRSLPRHNAEQSPGKAHSKEQPADGVNLEKFRRLSGEI